MIKNSMYMIRISSIVLALCLTGVWCLPTQAGNPDRKGQAGATQLLINPWARNTGWHSADYAGIRGLEAMRLNVAGLSKISGLEAGVSHTTWLQGTDINVLNGGLAFHLDQEGYNTLGISFMSFDFGDITETTVDNPDGIGELNFSTFNLGVGYSHKFSDQINAGVLARYFSEGITNINATGLALDVGVQYQTGKNDRARFGVSLRNVGPAAQYEGDGFSVDGMVQGSDVLYPAEVQSNEFELPSQLNIGIAYDFIQVADSLQNDTMPIAPPIQVTGAASFSSNAFDKDQYRLGAEVTFRDLISLRSGYLFTEGGFSDELTDENRTSVYTGIAFGASVDIPLSGGKNKQILTLDYSYRDSDPFNGVHTIGGILKL